MMQIEFRCASFNEGRNRLNRLQPDTHTCGIQNSGATGTVSRGHHGSGDKGLSRDIEIRHQILKKEKLA